MSEVDRDREVTKPLLANNIIAGRRALGMTAEKFSEFAEIPYPTLRDIEAGISGGRRETIEAIAKALDVEDWQLRSPDCFTDKKVEAIAKSQEQRGGTDRVCLNALIGILNGVDDEAVILFVNLARKIKNASETDMETVEANAYCASASASEDLAKVFARNVKEEFLKNGLTQAAFARRIGMNKVQLGKYLSANCEPGLGIIVKIATGLGVEPGKLLRNMK